MRGHRARAIAVNAGLLLGALLVGALLVEGVLRLFDLYPPVRYHLLPPHARLRDVQTSWDVTYETNAMGLRWDEIAEEKPPGVVRVALVGDSFTFGMGCARDETAPDALQRRYRAAGVPVEVLNVSNFSINPNAYADLVREIALPLGADIVVVTVCGNDAALVAEPTRDRRLVRAVAEHSNLVTLLRIFWRSRSLGAGSVPRLDTDLPGGLPNDPDGKRARALAEFRRVHGSQYNNLVAAMALDPDAVARWMDPVPDSVGWRDFQRYIGEIDDLCRARRVPLILGIVPDGASVDPKQIEIRRAFGVPVAPDALTAPSGFQRLVFAYAERRGIPFLDPTAAFRSVRDGLYLEGDIHWSAAGNALYAAELARFLEPWVSARTSALQPGGTPRP